MQRIEDLLNQILLLRTKGIVDAMLAMHIPPVADEVAATVVDRQANLLSLLVGEALVELHWQRVSLHRILRTRRAGHGQHRC